MMVPMTGTSNGNSTAKDSAAEQVVRAGGDVASASVGGLLGLMFAGPPGIVLGAAAAVVVGDRIKSVLDRVAGNRAVTVFTLAKERIRAEAESGRLLRADGFFDASASGRSAGEEVLERLVQAAQLEPEERKLPLIANLYASIAFREDVDRAMASLFVRTAEQLSYRQLCLISVFMTRAAYALRATDYVHVGDGVAWPAIDLASPLGGVLQESYDLFTRGLIDGTDGAMDGRLDSHTSLTDICPAKMMVQGTGVWLYDLMELGTLPQRELDDLVAQLST
jgi:hypothetical protein